MPAPPVTARVAAKAAGPPRGGRLARWALAVLGMAGIAGFAWFNLRPAADPLAKIDVAESRLLRAADEAEIEHVNPASRPELLFRVTLDHAPQGRRLWLACDWLDPAGRIVHQNHYQTLRIDEETWHTQAPFSLPSDAPHGSWTVQMKHDGRLLAKQTFLVNDQPAPPMTPRPVKPIAVAPPVKPVPSVKPAPVDKPAPPAKAPPPAAVTPPPDKPALPPAVAADSPDKPGNPPEATKSGTTKKSGKWYRRKKPK